MRERLELQEAIERQRSRVNAMIEQGTDFEELMIENRKLDRLVIEYMELERSEKPLFLFSERIK